MLLHAMAARRRKLESIESIEQRLDREERYDREAQSSDLVDVPAAVVCLTCGEADCSGCETSEQSRSGIVSIVAWERIGAPLFSRLWSTARSTTRDAEGFFELMPDGPVLPALRFAAICELLAATAVLLTVTIILGFAAPEWLRHLAFDPDTRAIALRVLVLGLPSFAALLVLAHVAHGLSIDVGASRNGARSSRSRALRFGLYACGWDLVIGPIGAIVVAVKEGVSAMFGLASLASDVPGTATNAFLRGCYRLEGERAKKARGTAFLGAVVATGLFVVIILAALVFVATL